MSSFTISNLPDYSSITVTFSFDDSFDTAGINLKVYTTEAKYKEDTPTYNYDIVGITTGNDLTPTDFDEGFTEFVNGIYLITVTAYDGDSNVVEALSEKYLINYNLSVPIALSTIEVCRQLEEDDDEHLEEALWAIWGEEMLVGMDRGAAVGLLDRTLNLLEYTDNLINE